MILFLPSEGTPSLLGSVLYLDEGHRDGLKSLGLTSTLRQSWEASPGLSLASYRAE